MLTCKDMTEEAHALVDGELGFWRRINVRFHLLMCKYCRRYVNQLMLTLRTLNESELLEQQAQPSDAEIDAIVARLKDSDQGAR